MTLYRAVSEAERADYYDSRLFRTAANTLEGKQFFFSDEAVTRFVASSQIQTFDPPYMFIFNITINDDCFASIPHLQQDLDFFPAITVDDVDLFAFSQCVSDIIEVIL